MSCPGKGLVADAVHQKPFQHLCQTQQRGKDAAGTAFFQLDLSFFDIWLPAGPWRDGFADESSKDDHC